MGRFTKVSKAAANTSSAYFIEGNHDVTIVALKAFDGNEGLTFVAEVTCDRSTNSKMAVGGTYAMILKLEKHKSAPGDLTAFMDELVPLVLDGESYPEDPVEREELLESFTDEGPKGNPAKGIKMRVEAWVITTKSGTPFTKLRWSELKSAAA